MSQANVDAPLAVAPRSTPGDASAACPCPWAWARTDRPSRDAKQRVEVGARRIRRQRSRGIAASPSGAETRQTVKRRARARSNFDSSSASTRCAEMSGQEEALRQVRTRSLASPAYSTLLTLQVLMQLQDQHTAASRALATVRAQAEAKERQRRIAEITLGEISAVPDNDGSKLYRGVGKMCVFVSCAMRAVRRLRLRGQRGRRVVTFIWAALVNAFYRPCGKAHDCGVTQHTLTGQVRARNAGVGQVGAARRSQVGDRGRRGDAQEGQGALDHAATALISSTSRARSRPPNAICAKSRTGVEWQTEVYNNVHRRLS